MEARALCSLTEERTPSKTNLLHTGCGLPCHVGHGLRSGALATVAP